MKIGDKIKLCFCGCGEYITYKLNYKYKPIPKYINGHQPNWNKGLTRLTDERVKNMYKPQFGKECPICKKIFYVTFGLKDIKKTCSKECSKTYISLSRKGKTPKNINILLEHIQNSIVERINKNCLFCNKTFKTTLKKNKKYCSIECYWKSLEGKITNWAINKGKHSEYSRKLIGERTKLMWKNPESIIKLKKSFKSKYTPEVKERMSKIIKEQFTSGKRDIIKNTERLRKCNIGRKISKEHKQLLSDLRKKDYREGKLIFPKKDTKIEVKVQDFLKQLNIDFFTHQYMNIEHGYQCDIFIPSLNLVIECDGDYWHKYPVGRDIDNIRTKELLEKGFKVLRLWEHEIKIMSPEYFREIIKRNLV